MTQALARRMSSQGLAPPFASDVAGAARAAVGLQAQDLRASQLAVRARARGLTQADVERACGERPTVVRTWLMRGTLHLVPAEDVRWLLSLLGPDTVRRQRPRRVALGLDDELCGRALAALPEALADGPLTRAELVTALGQRGVVLSSARQAPAHLVLYAAASGLICRGPERGVHSTFVLLDSWVPPVVAPGDDAATELARRYFAAFSPATAEDFATWSGLAAGSARRAVVALGDELTAVSVDGEPAWIRAGAEPIVEEGSWRLLPAFDTYVVGYRHRRWALDDRFAARVNAGGGWVHPTVVRDGRIVGTWRLKRHSPDVTVAVEMFEGSARGDRPTLEAEVADIGRFLGLEAEATLC